MNRPLRPYRALLFVGAALLSLASACVPPQIMISNYPLGNRLVRFSMQRSAEAPGTFDLFMQACTLQPNATANECRQTLVLQNVNPRTVY